MVGRGVVQTGGFDSQSRHLPLEACGAVLHTIVAGAAGGGAARLSQPTAAGNPCTGACNNGGQLCHVLNTPCTLAALGPCKPHFNTCQPHPTAAPPTWTQSWSNVPDYMAPDEFLRLASFLGGAAPSSCPTTHTMHSMNWVQCVKGACFIDYCLSDDREVRTRLLRQASPQCRL
jgi:hypothetical protein